MPDDSPLVNKRYRWTIVPRILASLCFAVLVSGLGLAQPFLWHGVATALEPGLFGDEYPLLIPLILATPGVLGGGILGLLAGAIVPNRVGLALALMGLALLHMATAVYILVHPSGLVLTLHSILAPAIVVELTLAGLLCIFRRKRAV